MRREIGWATQFVQGNHSRKIKKNVDMLMKNNRIHAREDEVNPNIIQCLDTMKQKLSVLAHRLARYKKNYKRKQDNSYFINNEKRFYRNVKQERTPKNLQYPSLSDITEFWQQQLAVPENFNKMARWI
jgi:hypothetical protein